MTPLSFDFKVIDLVLLGRSPYKGFFQGFDAADLVMARAALRQVDLEEFEQRSVLSLSGGERQRAFLAQAIAQDTPLLLLDEPTNHLDIFHQHDFLGRVAARKEKSVTVISAFHDLSLAARYADRILVLQDGNQVQFGLTDETLTEKLVEEVFRMRCEIMRDADSLNFSYLGPVHVD